MTNKMETAEMRRREASERDQTEYDWNWGFWSGVNRVPFDWSKSAAWQAGWRWGRTA